MLTQHRWERLLATVLSTFLLGCPQGDATESGFFEVTWRNGKAWLVTPERKLFLSMGINHVGDHSYRLRNRAHYNPVRNQYAGDKEAWIRQVLQRMGQWGFNTIGAWSDKDFHQRKRPYTRMLYAGRSSDWDAVLERVFDDEFESLVRKNAGEAAQFRNDPHLVGYFLDNELPWWGEFGWKAAGQKSLFEKYAGYDRGDANKRALVRFIEEHYESDIQSFNSVWATKYSSFDALLPRLSLKPRTRQQKKVRDAWAGRVADRFFRLTTSAVRKEDPNHLILGVRFAGLQIREVVEACGRYVDVVSVNHYSKSGEIDVELLDNFYYDSRKPLMITEYSYRAMENQSGNRNRKGADVTVPTQKDRAERTGEYVKDALGLPYIVGLHWFEWADQPPEGRFDGEDSNYGLVDIHDREYELLTRAHTRLNRRANRLHREGSRPLPAARREAPTPRYRTARPGVRVEPVRRYLNEQDTPSSVWSDASKGGAMAVTTRGATVVLSFKTGSGWGCGATFPPSQPPLLQEQAVDLAGYHYLEFEALIPEEVEVSVFLTESGSGEVGKASFEGLNGADGESYTLVPVSGQGQWKKYRLAFADLERRAGWGNQSGNNILDLQGLARIDFFLSGNQGSGEILLRNLVFKTE